MVSLKPISHHQLTIFCFFPLKTPGWVLSFLFTCWKMSAVASCFHVKQRVDSFTAQIQVAAPLYIAVLNLTMTPASCPGTTTLSDALPNFHFHPNTKMCYFLGHSSQSWWVCVLFFPCWKNDQIHKEMREPQSPHWYVHAGYVQKCSVAAHPSTPAKWPMHFVFAPPQNDTSCHVRASPSWSHCCSVPRSGASCTISYSHHRHDLPSKV